MVNVKPVQMGNTTRMSFSKINEVIDMPNLIEIQKNSYQWFLDEGIKEVFNDISSITDSNGKLVLSFVDYRIDDTPKYTIEECKERDVTYAAPLRVKARLRNEETGEVAESEIFMGDFPLMTDSGTFVINGAERVIVSQLVRSPGVYFGFEYDKTGKKLFTSQVIPNRGAWLEYEMDSNDIFYVRIDKNRKIPITTFIRALGVGSDEEIYELFGEAYTTAERFRAQLDAADGDVVVEVNSPGGMVTAGAEIYEAIRGYAGDIECRVVGQAASAASVIACAAKSSITPMGTLFLHNCIGAAQGNHNAMREAAQAMESVDENIMNAYRAKTGMTDSQIYRLMERNTTISATKAVELGFADDVLRRSADPEPVAEAVLFSRKAVNTALVNKLTAKYHTPAQEVAIPAPAEIGRSVDAILERLNTIEKII